MSIAGTTIIDNQSTAYAASAGSAVNKTETTASFKDAIGESVVDTFKRRHPDSARHVEQQVKAGRAVREKNGVAGMSTEHMTMEEYQRYFYALLDTIPYDSTQLNNTTTLTITDEGWEQMRRDPDYEAWILGYFVEDRAVHNPFFGWGNNDGSVIFEHFGASIEEHHGEGFNKAALKGGAKDDDDKEEDWWIKRHKRMKKLLKEQVERAMARDAARKSMAKEEYVRQQYISSQRQHSFLTTGAMENGASPMPESPAPAMAAVAYNSILDLFGTGAGAANL